MDATRRSARWGIPDVAAFQQPSALGHPKSVANGDSEATISLRLSHLSGGLIPDVTVRIHANAGHGFLFERRSNFGADSPALAA